jgi:hypothetical protein
MCIAMPNTFFCFLKTKDEPEIIENDVIRQVECIQKDLNMMFE